MKICPKDAEHMVVRLNAKFWHICGATLTEKPDKVCECGHTLTRSQKYCDMCGRKITEAA
jgi:hypothetical protein